MLFFAVGENILGTFFVFCWLFMYGRLVEIFNEKNGREKRLDFS